MLPRDEAQPDSKERTATFATCPRHLSMHVRLSANTQVGIASRSTLPFVLCDHSPLGRSRRKSR